MRNAVHNRSTDEELERIEKIQDGWERNRQLDVWLDQKTKLLKKEKFLDCPTPGYDKFFLIPAGADLKITDDNLTIDGKVTSGKLANAFIKMTKARQINRVLVSKFIGGIAV